MELKRITRHTLPTKYDTASYGTICECRVDDTPKLYIQVNKIEEEPHWEPVGSLFEKVLESIHDSDTLIQALLEMIDTNATDFSSLYDILKKKFV